MCGLDSNFRHGKMGWLARLTDKIIDIGYIQTLGLNWKSPIKNEIAGITNNYIVQGMGKFIDGQVRFATSPAKAIKISKDYGFLEGFFADYANTFVGKLNKVTRWSMIGQRIGEYHIRTSFVAGELTEAEWASGVITSERAREIKNGLAFAQGIFSKTESPLWVQHWLGRTMMMLGRWRITNFNIFIKSARTAKAEFKAGNPKGPGTKMFLRMLTMYGLGMYLGYKIRNAGFKYSKDIATIVQSMAEVVNSVFMLFTTDQIMQMATNNMPFRDISGFFHSVQELAAWIHFPGVQEPSDWQMKGGLEDLYIAPIQTFKDLFGEGGNTVDDAWGAAKKAQSVDEVWGSVKNKTLEEVWK